MHLCVVGINHKTADATLRAQLAFDVQGAVLLASSLAPAFVVSTCNRTEVYAVLPVHQVVNVLCDSKGLDKDTVIGHLYAYEGKRALTHWLRVASGLDSMILGEPQILGQMRQSVACASEAGALFGPLARLCQQVFFGAKRIRFETAIGVHSLSFGAQVVAKAREFFAPVSLADKTLALVAAGEMNRLIAHNMAGAGIGRILIVNRTKVNAQTLAGALKVPTEVIEWSDLGNALARADMVCACTGSMDVIITPDMLDTRKRLLIDLAIPADIDPALGDAHTLIGLDALQDILEDNKLSRQKSALEAEVLVAQLVAGLDETLRAWQAGTVIAQYRSLSKVQGARLAHDAHKALYQGKDPHEVVNILTHRLSQSLTHAPTKLIEALYVHGDNAHQDLAKTVLMHNRTQHKGGVCPRARKKPK